MTVQKISRTFMTEVLKPTGKREVYRDTTVVGLQLVVSADAKSRVWYFEYRNREGQKRRHRIGTTSQYDATNAKAKARELQHKVAAGVDPQGEKVAGKDRTLRAWIEGGYQNRLQQLRTGVDEHRRLTTAWAKILDVDMAQLTPDKIEAIHNAHLKQGLKPATALRYWQSLSAALAVAKRAGIISHNPILDASKAKPRLQGRVRYLGQHDAGERQRFLDALDDAPDHLRIMSILAMNTGLRRGEIFKLRWSDVDFTKRTITVQAENSKNSQGRVVWP